MHVQYYITWQSDCTAICYAFFTKAFINQFCKTLLPPNIPTLCYMSVFSSKLHNCFHTYNLETKSVLIVHKYEDA